MKKIKFSFTIAIATFLAVSCSGSQVRTEKYDKDSEVQALFAQPAPSYPDVKFAHMSDLHIYSPELGTEGEAFQDYLNHDRKMLADSKAIVQASLDKVAAEKPDFLLLTGDLTKDGENQNHKMLAGMLKSVEAKGIPVYVVPGNHDLINGHAYRYTEDGKEHISSVNLKEFAEIYNDFGYSEALVRDPASLSYVAEPAPGLLLLALDSTRAQENSLEKEPITGGRFSKETLSWIEDRLIEARRQNKPVVAMMHHGVIDHYSENKEYYPEYLVDENDDVAEMFATYGVRVVFSGHFHAQDITLRRFPEIAHNNVLYDIETGSAVTYPSPLRVLKIKANQMNIQSQFITSIPGQANFTEFSRDYVFRGTEVMAKDIMDGYHVSDEAQDYLAPLVAQAYVAHLEGDEDPSKKPEISPKGLGFMGKMVYKNRKPLIESWWEDLEPADNNLTIDLK